MLDDIFHLLPNWVGETVLHQDHKPPDNLLLSDSDFSSPYTDMHVEIVPSNSVEFEHPHLPEEHLVEEHVSEPHYHEENTGEHHQGEHTGEHHQNDHHGGVPYEGHFQHAQSAELSHPYVQHVEPEPQIPQTYHRPPNHSEEPFGAEWKDAIVPHETHWNLADFHGVGHPAYYSHYWQHQHHTDCAIMAEGEILASITGHHLTEQQLSHIAEQNGWYDPHKGTMPENVGKILEWEGIPVDHLEHATFRDLIHALEHEQRVIVGVNANEIWHPYRDTLTDEPVKLPHAGHTVWVTGIDQEPDGAVKVILTDSAAPHGQMEAVDVRDFLNAWEDTGNFMASTPSFPLVP